MCGIAGCSSELILEAPETYLEKMNSVMVHRGPDDGSYYSGNEMALCHRRLSIIDLSVKGRQPMKSSDGKQVIVFNGEIYNFQVLREELLRKGYIFDTRTDTEVLLNLYKEYGAGCLQMLRGMYAFAIWDNEKKELFLCRDRIGKKPLYYHYDGKNIAFASEIKSLLQIPGIRRDIDITSVIDYLKYSYVPHPKSIYRDIHKLEPGHFLIYRDGRIRIEEYWDVDFSAPLDSSGDAIAEQLLSIISGSVKTRLIADVPLGAFLSGGIDSSAVVALMAQAKQESVNTCTIGFNSAKHDEAQYAKEFSKLFNTNHHEYYVSENEDIENIIKKLVWHFDEPFADASMIPTYHVSRMARKKVTVAMSGDGGDENFGGYEKYTVDLLENKVRDLVPDILLGTLSALSSGCERGAGKKIYSLASSARLSPAEGFYVSNTFFPDPVFDSVISDRLRKESRGYSPFEHTSRYFNKANGRDHVSRILYTDLKSYLPGDILVKVDRMSMANSLEVRSPLLDHEVIEFAAKIPSALKINRRGKKIILKKAFRKILPEELMRRKKHGFDVPLDNWLRGELKQMAYNYIFQKGYMKEFFRTSKVRMLWDKHQDRKANIGTILWIIFIFSIWYEEFIEG